MPPPPQCPNEVYEIMKSCWDKKSDARPTFPQLRNLLSEVIRQEFSPEEDYYTGAAFTEIADTDVVENVADCADTLTRRIIVQMLSKDISPTEDAVDEILQEIKKEVIQSKSNISTKSQNRCIENTTSEML